MHLEGPFINKARRGVHPPDSIALPSIEMLEQFRAAADGLVKIVTVAPEIPGALQLIARAVADGLVVAVGHTDADYEQARAAIKAGARHAVHVYNAMRPFTHRDPGVISAIMTDTDVTAEIIADGVHVAAPAIQVLLGTKGFDTVLLVSDGTAATGMRDGNYRLGNFEVTVKDGVVPQLRRQTGWQHADAGSRAALHGGSGRAVCGCLAHGDDFASATAGTRGKERHFGDWRRCGFGGFDAGSACGWGDDARRRADLILQRWCGTSREVKRFDTEDTEKNRSAQRKQFSTRRRAS